MHTLNEEIKCFFKLKYDKQKACWKDYYRVNNIYSHEKKHLQCVNIKDSVYLHYEVAYKSLK